ncbi:hypothetical protein OIU77_017161 [Salix suchowensis]|uniref:EXPRESSED PROTEIN-RELATED n=2 Tax=Salix TaxID=40685 RepID=A0A9Q0X4J8_9ROSI|nr:Growth arrest and DNA damage-inducible protein-interacting protein [Salix suchowensis]KAG5253647.1 Growth arrest and DNA damage-inducible protein-interacting protein [Salix suchowensis]KAJ6303223.1 hypothetical protein OIU77_017161 [Salix suchowensis]KAJ6315831.1 hypothetical protein OIU78_019158 [Salix suchowensis]KAJ6777891.1 EXPRESSED PROTEIN-RELATED [Salix koriyanagi]
MGSSYSSSYNSDQPPSPVHLYFFLLIFLMFIGLTWYINYEPVLESLFDQGKLILMASPLLLLLLVHLFSNDGHQYGSRLSYYLPFPEKDSLHRAGGTPWGVGFLLVFLFFLISYHSSFQERWFPLLSRS